MSIENQLIDKIRAVAKYISQCVENEENPNLEAAAKVARISKFHFHRIYKIVCGETFFDTVTRFRLARAAGHLQNRYVPIIEAALSANFSTGQAFAKAIKRETNMTASTLKNDPEKLAQTISSLRFPKPIDENNSGAALQIELCSISPMEIAVLKTKGKYPTLFENYGLLFEACAGPENVKAILGFPLDDIELINHAVPIEFDCALYLNELPDEAMEGIEIARMNGGQYLSIRHTGSDALLNDTIDNLYQYCLEANEFELSDEPALFHYLDDPEFTPEAECRTDIYLKVNFSNPN